MTRQQSGRLKRAFLEHFRVYGNVTGATRAVGIERSTVYKWQEIDDQFVAAFREAEIEATEHLETEARRRAVNGVESTKGIYDRMGKLVAEESEIKYSDTLLIFLLKARNPEKYRDNAHIEHSGPNGASLIFSIAVKDDIPAEV